MLRHVYYTPKGVLSKTDKTRLNRAVKLAQMSSCRIKHGAIIYKGGRALSVGINTFRNHPSIVENPASDAAYHAEAMALKAYTGDLNGATIYVARWTVHGEAMSKPCDRCVSELRKRGVKKVIYTIDTSLELRS